MNRDLFVDIDQRPITDGSTVEVKHCVGRYGQTETVIGIVQQIDEYGGLTLKVGGKRKYVAGVFTYCFNTGLMRGYGKHNDFEHGHTKYCRILAAKK